MLGNGHKNTNDAVYEFLASNKGIWTTKDIASAIKYTHCTVVGACRKLRDAGLLKFRTVIKNGPKVYLYYGVVNA